MASPPNLKISPETRSGPTDLFFPVALKILLIMPGWDKVDPRRDPGETRNTNPDWGTGGAEPTKSPLRL